MSSIHPCIIPANICNVHRAREVKNIVRKCVTVKSQPCLLCTGEKYLPCFSQTAPGRWPTHCFCKQIMRMIGSLVVKTNKLSVLQFMGINKPFQNQNDSYSTMGQKSMFSFLRLPIPSVQAFVNSLPME